MNTSNNGDYAALLLRVTVGVMLLVHGLTKIFVFTIPGTIGFFARFGYPGWLADAVILGEVGGGLFLVLGVYTRWIALTNILVLLVTLPVHWPNGWMFANKGAGWEYTAILVVVSLAVALLGNGAFAYRPPWIKDQAVGANAGRVQFVQETGGRIYARQSVFISQARSCFASQLVCH